jgi:formylglycine-generating enzyme required for sulfatase activity
VKVFLSATTAQLQACRTAVRSDLASIGCEVRVQEDFQTGPRTLLERIEEYVAACDIVVAIVGDAYGAEAEGDGIPGVEPPRSYTQWEYYFARGERLVGPLVEPKRLYVYFASGAFRAAHPVEQAEESRSRQDAFEREIKASGKFWASFESEHHLGQLVLRDIRQLDANPLQPIDDDTYRALKELASAITSGDDAVSMPEPALARVRQHSPRTDTEHALQRVAAWADQRHAVDKRFTHLTLLLDQGPDAPQTRWQPQAEPFEDLRDVLKRTGDSAPAIVLLGPPGSGKSTVLRRLEYDLAIEAVRDSPRDGRWTFFVPLGGYRAPAGGALPLPHDWLTGRWAGDFPRLPPFDQVSRSGRLTLLLDALNEIPHTGRDDYAERVRLWRECVADMVRRAPATRVVFSCRSLDYSELLSTPELAVPQARIERLSDDQVQAFLAAYSGDAGDSIWRQLKGAPQLDLFRSPYYLRLLIGQTSDDGGIPAGRAALFTGFVREALHREVSNQHRLFAAGGLLDDRDRDRIARREWRNPHDLPSRGPLVAALSTFAYSLQERREGGEETQVRVSFDEALRLFGPERPHDMVRAGVALQLLEDDSMRDEVLFVHQLLQEYFAARKVAATPAASLAAVASLAQVPWREGDLPPARFESDNEPLPPAPSTGWEETFMLAAAPTSAEPFLAALMPVNLPLAGRCAAQPDVTISPALRETIARSIIERSRDSRADLRSRIAAARALGELGDPRYERRGGLFGECLVPAFIEIPAATYVVGSEDGYANERPVHPVGLDRFNIARFAVTNAEWRLFMLAGGYDDERWWETDAGRRWRRGEETSEGPKAASREFHRGMQGRFDDIRAWLREGRITSKEADDFEAITRMSDGEFDALLEEWHPAGRQTQPARWNDPAFNHPAQPVVGVSWHEARAYCAWLAAASGFVVRLPTEVEWEAAARGTNGRRFAWGEPFDSSRCNTFETHVRGTTPVGVFPLGETPDGVADLTGTVWEWTSSAYRGYPYEADDGREDATREDVRRVLRGGSWDSSLESARAAARFDFDPGDRNDLIGFRVVCVSPIR